MHALWSLIGSGPLDGAFHGRLLAHADPGFRAWGVRAAGNYRTDNPPIVGRVKQLAEDPAADVRLQVAIAARKLPGVDAPALLLTALANSAGDKLMPHIVWQNLQPLLESNSQEVLAILENRAVLESQGVGTLMPLLVDRLLARDVANPAPVARLIEILTAGGEKDFPAARTAMGQVAKKVQTREISGERLAAFKTALAPVLQQIHSSSADRPLYFDAALLSTTLGDPAGIEAVRKTYTAANAPNAPAAVRIQALDALVAARDPDLREAVAVVLAKPRDNPRELRDQTLASLGRFGACGFRKSCSTTMPSWKPPNSPRQSNYSPSAASGPTICSTRSRPAGSRPRRLNVNQVRTLLSSRDQQLADKVRAQWGSVRTQRNPQRDQVIAQVRARVKQHPGNASTGQEVFRRVCGQCHKIYGEGQEVGPDITANGRASVEQLLSNVLDPSLVIGAAYQARIVVTSDGRVLTGLLAEDNEQRVVLKVQGGKLETIARGEVDEIKVSQLSLMPEELEKQLKPEELSDLFAFLLLDKPPSDPAAKRLPDEPPVQPQQTGDPALFDELIAHVAPGFGTRESGEGGLALLTEHQGRAGVLRTHPLSREKPCVLRGTFEVPADKKTELLVSVSHHPSGDWQLLVKGNGKVLHESIIGPKTATDGWADIAIELTPFAGQKLELELHNAANDWANEFGYWGRVEVVSQ